MKENPGTRRPRRWKLSLTLVLGLPLGLMLLAWLMYKTGLGVPQLRHNHGILLSPPFQAAPALPLYEQGWTLLLPAPGVCAEDCRQRLYRTRQVHVALGREAWRLQRLHWATTNAPTREESEFLRREHPGIRVHHQVPAPEWSAQVGRDPGVTGRWDDYFYLVDPRGFLVMAYKNTDSGAGLLEDLRFLLRISRRG